MFTSIPVAIQGLKSSPKSRNRHSERDGGREIVFFQGEALQPINVFDVTYHVHCYAKFPAGNTMMSIYPPGSTRLQ